MSKDRPILKTMFKMSSFKSVIYRLEEQGLLEGYWPIYLSMQLEQAALCILAQTPPFNSFLCAGAKKHIAYKEQGKGATRVKTGGLSKSDMDGV